MLKKGFGKTEDATSAKRRGMFFHELKRTRPKKRKKKG